MPTSAPADLPTPTPSGDATATPTQTPIATNADAATPAQPDALPEPLEPSQPAPRNTEPFPDQITGGGPRLADDRPLPPVTYRPPQSVEFRPQPSAYVDGRPKTLMPRAKNGPAKASLIFIVLSLLGGAAAFWWLPGVNPALAES